METPEPKRSISLEERLGRNWLNKLGIVALVIGVSSLLGLRMRTMGPLGKSTIGMLLSLALLVGGLLLERRSKYRIFARAMIGGGWALTFFVTFALYHVDAMRVLPNQALDLVLMFGVAAAMVWHSLHYKSQVVTSLAFLLAFVTVGVSEVTLFSLVASVLLVAGLIFVAARERWFELGLAGLIGAYLNHFLWLRRVLPGGGQPGHPFPEFFASAGLLILYLLAHLPAVLCAARAAKPAAGGCLVVYGDPEFSGTPVVVEVPVRASRVGVLGAARAWYGGACAGIRRPAQRSHRVRRALQHRIGPVIGRNPLAVRRNELVLDVAPPSRGALHRGRAHAGEGFPAARRNRRVRGLRADPRNGRPARLRAAAVPTGLIGPLASRDCTPRNRCHVLVQRGVRRPPLGICDRR
jgi:hypothetical protein